MEQVFNKIQGLPFAHEESELKVGKYYSVVCAVMKHRNPLYDKKEYLVPILPVEHKDAQFNVNTPHYHLDGRFRMPVLMRQAFEVKDGVTNCFITHKKHESFIQHYQYSFLAHGFVVMKKRCIRQVAGINPPFKYRELPGGKWAIDPDKPTLYGNWYKSMMGKSCKGRKCPHLGATMALVNGKLVCPMHNLMGCPEEEVIVKYDKTVLNH